MSKNHIHRSGTYNSARALQKCLPCCRLKAGRLENDMLYVELKIRIIAISEIRCEKIMIMMMM